MKRFQPLTRSYVALGILTLTLLAGFSSVTFADDAMNKDMAKDAMMDMDKMMSEGMININTATAKQLETLPGIGKELARRIVGYRTDNGDFKGVQELVKVKGIGKETLAKMEERLTTGTDTEETHMPK